MTDYREIIRQKRLEFSNLAIASSLRCSHNTVSEVLKLSETHSLEWSIPDYEYVYNKLANPSITLSLLWTEYGAKCEAEHIII